MIEAAAPTYFRLYVWERPVRAFHWVNATCVLALALTGFVIGNPMRIAYAAEAYQQNWFGTVRFVHFAAGWIFLVAFVARIYWGFVGDQYARWRHYIPHTRWQWREIVEVLRIDIFQTKVSGEFSSGHNALAGLTYSVSFLVYGFQIATGFALYASMSDAWFPSLFVWVVPLFGGEAGVRFWHHAAMWFFIIFTMIHVYLVFYHDYVEGRGTTSSMVGGWKFARVDTFVPPDEPDESATPTEPEEETESG